MNVHHLLSPMPIEPAPAQRPGVFRRILIIFCLPLFVVFSAYGEELSNSALQQIQALELDKDARTPAQKKMDSQLIYATAKSRTGLVSYSAPDLQPAVNIMGDNRVLVDIDALVSEDLIAAIKQQGGEIINSFATYHAIRALVPLVSIEPLADRGDVRFIQPAVEATTNTGSVTSQGDVTHLAAAARTAFNVNGTGVKVGVLSDSVDFLAASQALGDIGTVTVLPGQSGVNTCGAGTSPCTGEGTAMLEIIADLAPGANLFFATGNGGPAQMATNIRALQAAGCNIIVDDLTYLNESPFQDGPIAQAVNTVSATGVLYFSSARNSGNKDHGTSGTWEGDFRNGGAAGAPIPGAGNLHNFGHDTTFNTVTAVNASRADLFWADPLGKSANDYDLFVLDSTGNNVLHASTISQTGTQDPYEYINTPLNVGERIVIVRRPGAAKRFLHLDTGRDQLTISTAGNVRGHNASGAANAFSVAATNVANSYPNPFTGGATNPVETFSSDGPRRIFFKPNGSAITPGNFSSTGGKVLQKPDITAADGNVSSAAFVVGGPFNPFFGTSAAAPHAAAIAALLKSSNAKASPAKIRRALTSTALDIEKRGVDRDSGAGIIMALPALKFLNSCHHRDQHGGCYDRDDER